MKNVAGLVACAVAMAACAGVHHAPKGPPPEYEEVPAVTETSTTSGARTGSDAAAD